MTKSQHPATAAPLSPTRPALRVLIGAAAAALTLFTAACAGTSPRQTSPGPATARADSIAELEALYHARTAQARGRYVAADVRFITDMIAHHGQAILMAQLVAERAGDPRLHTLAARIRTGQQDEIALMQQWLRERELPVPEVHIAGTTLMIHGIGEHDHAHMPGMLTPEQLIELEQARGADFDRLFLTHMIEHHRGAVSMVETLLAADGAAQDPTVFRLAADIQAEQVAEIGRMQRMLVALGIRTP